MHPYPLAARAARTARLGGFLTLLALLLPWAAWAQAPAINSISPASGPVGTVVTVTGTNFTAVTAVRFGLVNAPTFTVASATSLTVTVPAGAVMAPVSPVYVTTAAGTSLPWYNAYFAVPVCSVAGGLPPSCSLSPNNPPMVAAGGSVTLTAYCSVQTYHFGNTTNLNSLSGFNGLVRAVLALPNGQLLVGGDFTAYAHNGTTTSVQGLARLYTDGSLNTGTDGTVTPSLATGAYGVARVYALALQPDGKVLVGGDFRLSNTTSYPNLLRINVNGTLDSNFYPYTYSSFDGAVCALAVQPDGKIVVGGNFTTWNNSAAFRIMRLYSYGGRDATFTAGFGYNTPNGYDAVYALLVQPDNKLVVGGSFDTYYSGTGTSATRYSVARLGATGSLDLSFAGSGAGFGGEVYALALVPDGSGKVLAGGLLSGKTIAWLSPSGTVLSYPLAFNGPVRALALEPSGRLLAGGDFTTATYSGTTRAAGGIAEFDAYGGLYNGYLLGSGVGFGSAGYSVAALDVQADGYALVGGGFSSYTYNGTTTPTNNIARLTPTGSYDNVYRTVALTYVINPGASSGATRVVTSGGTYTATATSAGGCSYTSNPVTVRFVPGIGSFAATSGPAGTTISLTGTDLTGATAITFSGSSGNVVSTGFTVASPTSITGIVVPAGAITGPLTVTTANGTSLASSQPFTVVPPPTLTGVSPAAELPGQVVALTGTGFTSGSTVSFGGTAASVTYGSATSLTAVVPAGLAAGSAPVSVTAGTTTGPQPFTALAVYDGGTLDACAAAVPATASVNDGQWHYLLSSGGQVVAAYSYAGASLGSLAMEVLRANPAAPVRKDSHNHYYLDRNFHLTASAGPFPGRSVSVRFYGLNTEQARLQAADATATLASLKATQYSGANEDCSLSNDLASGEHRTLAAPASTPTGAPWFVAEVAVADHFSEFFLTGSSAPLPVELSAFTATLVDKAAVRLAWAIASEQNSTAFDVERSTDGRTFAAIGTVAAAGSSSSARSYGFEDHQVPKSLSPPVPLYYRLKQVDADGSFSYSPVRVVGLKGAAEGLSLFPNPATTGATLTDTTPSSLVQVYDALSRLVTSATADASGTAALALPAGLPTGVYVVRAGTKAVRLTVE